LPDLVSIIIGSRIGAYEIVSLLGAGGMGEVYRATDTVLKRQVALKVLPPEVANDPERVARFQREAEVLASLNHPNIAHLYGLERSGGTLALVMELVEGPTLADRIGQGAIPVDEALPIAKQIAEALEAAHEQGIIHRDLKPANIKVRDDGTVKVLDFGLAKALEPAATTGSSGALTNSPTITSPALMTGVGVLLGTAAYMSPEQAKGRPADKRSDIWAFGCVLYETLTGSKAFAGEDVSDTLANVLKGDPAWTEWPSTAPETIRRLVRRCLEKDRTKRVSDMSAVRYVLAEPLVPESPVALAGAASAMPRQPLWRRGVPVAVTALVVTALAAIIAGRVSRAPTAPVTRFAILLPEGQRFAVRSQVMAISPDGSRVVYATDTGQLYQRSMADMDTRPIAGTNLDVMSPFFSPDGQWIGFYSFPDSMLKKVAVSGGAPVSICRTTPPHGVTWEGDWILFADEGAKGILRVSPDGGEPEVVVAVKPGEVFGAPHLLEDGKVVLFSVASGANWDQAQIVAQRIGSSERTVVLRGGSEGSYVPTGHLIYMSGRTLLAVPFDLPTLQTRGGPVPILEGVRRFDSRLPDASVTVSRTGSLIYIPSPAISLNSAAQTVALVTPDGKPQPLNMPLRPYRLPRVSPDGRLLAVESGDVTEASIWIKDLTSDAPSWRLTTGGHDRFPVWTSDSRRVTFQSGRGGDLDLYWQLADGSQPAERLTNQTGTEPHPVAWTLDDKTLLFAGPRGNPRSLFTFTFSRDRQGDVQPFRGDPNAGHAVFSRDGKWIAYTVFGVSGRTDVWVQPFPPTGAKYQISTDGGAYPVWSPDEAHLYYWTTLKQQFIAVDVQTHPTFAPRRSVVLPIDVNTVRAQERNYDITADGKQFVVITEAGSTANRGPGPPPPINVVLNWFTELQQRVPTR
jgi:serine/threonine-protein kinase